MFGITMAESGDEFVAPGPNSFDFSDVALFHIGGLAVTKPMIQLLFGALVVFVFFYAATRSAATSSAAATSSSSSPTW
jgi:F-type H+-transporting ATPase subunit a